MITIYITVPAKISCCSFLSPLSVSIKTRPFQVQKHRFGGKKCRGHALQAWGRWCRMQGRGSSGGCVSSRVTWPVSGTRSSGDGLRLWLDWFSVYSCHGQGCMTGLLTAVAKRQECLSGGRGGFWGSFLLGFVWKRLWLWQCPAKGQSCEHQGDFRGLRHFCRGQTSEVKVNESGYAFNTSRKYYVHQSIIGQKKGPKSTDLWQLSGEKKKPGCCSLHCTFPSHPDHQCQPCTVSGESNGSAPLHDHIWC